MQSNEKGVVFYFLLPSFLLGSSSMQFPPIHHHPGICSAHDGKTLFCDCIELHSNLKKDKKTIRTCFFLRSHLINDEAQRIC